MSREEQQSDGGPFEIKLGFAAAICPNCEVAREPGVCPECGTKIPEVEPGKLEQTRQKAFASLTGRARELVSSFDLGTGLVLARADHAGASGQIKTS